MLARSIGAMHLDRQVQLQVNTPTRDVSTRAEIASWADSGSPRWARVVESVGPYRNADGAAERDTYGRPIEIWLRWFTGFDQDHTRVVYEGRVLRIVGTAEIGRREFLKLACVEWAHE